MFSATLPLLLRTSLSFFTFPLAKLPRFPSRMMPITFVWYLALRGGRATHRVAPTFFILDVTIPIKICPDCLPPLPALPNGCDCELWLAGSTDLRYTPTLRAIADQQGIADRVQFLEYIPYSQLPTLINGSDRSRLPQSLGRLRLPRPRSYGLRHPCHHLQPLLSTRSSW